MLILYPGDVLNVFDAVGSNTDVEVWTNQLGSLYAAQAPSLIGSGIYTAQTPPGNIAIGVRCYNSGASAVTVTVSKTVANRTISGGGTTAGTYGIVKTTLQTHETLVIDDAGIRTLDVNGAVKGATSTSLSAATTITSTGANALAVGPAGTSNPTLNVDASTSSAATGLQVKGAAAAGDVALLVLSSGTNENLTVNTKGSGLLKLQTTGTGAVTIGSKLTMTSTASDAIAIGPAGATNPSFQVDASTASAATGWKMTAAAAAGGVALAVVSSGTNEAGKIDAKGSGAIAIGDTSTGPVYVNRGALAALQVGLTLTALGTTQSSTPTSAQLLGGFLTQTGATGAGAVTLPTGTALSTACNRTPATGDSFECVFANLGGGQTLTITGATGTTVVSGGAIATAKTAVLKFICTSANAWSIAVAGG